MGTTADKLNYLGGTKSAIKSALISKGVDVGDSDTFRSYSEKIKGIATRVDSSKPIKFYDYDGTLLYSYTVEEYANLGANPPLPTHEGLIAQDWNFSYMPYFVELYGYGIFGAQYKTDDLKSHIHVCMPQDDLSIALRLGYSGGVTVNWGDGTKEVSEGATIEHTYDNPGNYIIRVDADNYYLGVSSGGIGLVDNYPYYDRKITRIHIGERCFTCHFFRLASLKSISFPENTRHVDITEAPLLECVICSYPNSLDIASCHRLRILSTRRDSFVIQNLSALVEFQCSRSPYTNNGTRIINCPGILQIPQNVSFIYAEDYYVDTRSSLTGCCSLENLDVDNLKEIPDECFSGCSNLQEINIIQDGIIDYIGARSFLGCKSLKGNIILSDKVTTIPEEAFANCHSLNSVTAQGALTEIGARAFKSCFSLISIDLTACANIPTIDMTTFESVPSKGPLKIIVPDNLYEQWIVASYWKNRADLIIKESDYEG